MQTLMANEVEEVSGGVIPAILAGIAGAYIYDAMGGKEGIDEYIEKSVASASASIEYWYNQVTQQLKMGGELYDTDCLSCSWDFLLIPKLQF